MSRSKKISKLVVVSGGHRHEIDVSKSGKITVFRLGDPVNGILPDQATFDAFVRLLKQAAQEPNFVIVWNYALQIDQVKI